MKMRAAIYNGLKQVSLEEIEKPEVPQSGILVKNIRSGICGTDLHAYGIDGSKSQLKILNETTHAYILWICGKIAF